MSSDKELKPRLRSLMERPENQRCCDCNDQKPSWASLIVPPPGCAQKASTLGAFCCFLCSGAHRRLGVHICFVRSLTLDECKLVLLPNSRNIWPTQSFMKTNLNRLVVILSIQGKRRRLWQWRWEGTKG
jgi:hypothetical protein